VQPDFPNICEASNFYPLWLLAMLGLAAGWVRRRIPVSPLMALFTAFLIGLSLYFVVRFPEWLLRQLFSRMFMRTAPSSVLA